jgi:hypothetical protein
MNTRLTVAFALLATVSTYSDAFAWDYGCKVSANRAAGIDTAGATKVVIRAGAGDLEIRGIENTRRLEARGGACASTQELLDAIQINVRRERDVIYVETDLPQYDLERNEDRDVGTAYLNLGVALPRSIPVEALDSSGDAVVSNLTTLVMQDSSGDLTVRDVSGAVELQDSSGDLLVEDVGEVTLGDSSGDIRIQRVKRNVLIKVDSSGNIRVTNVGGSVIVESDSSGDIEVDDIGGEFAVWADGSGDIRHSNVRGSVSVPD